MRQDEIATLERARRLENLGPCPCGCGDPRRLYRRTASDECPEPKSED